MFSSSCLLDLDRFKDITTRLGHYAATALQEVTARLRGSPLQREPTIARLVATIRRADQDATPETSWRRQEIWRLLKAAFGHRPTRLSRRARRRHRGRARFRRRSDPLPAPRRRRDYVRESFVGWLLRAYRPTERQTILPVRPAGELAFPSRNSSWSFTPSRRKKISRETARSTVVEALSGEYHQHPLARLILPPDRFILRWPEPASSHPLDRVVNRLSLCRALQVAGRRARLFSGFAQHRPAIEDPRWRRWSHRRHAAASRSTRAASLLDITEGVHAAAAAKALATTVTRSACGWPLDNFGRATPRCST